MSQLGPGQPCACGVPAPAGPQGPLPRDGLRCRPALAGGARHSSREARLPPASRTLLCALPGFTAQAVHLGPRPGDCGVRDFWEAGGERVCGGAIGREEGLGVVGSGLGGRGRGLVAGDQGYCPQSKCRVVVKTLATPSPCHLASFLLGPPEGGRRFHLPLHLNPLPWIDFGLILFHDVLPPRTPQTGKARTSK